VHRIIHFFDKLEDRVREALSRKPILYTFIGAFSIVLFWRGVWMTADSIPFLNGPISIAISVSILLVTGLFVSFFVGDVIILSGVKKEKKIIEKTELEIEQDEITLRAIKNEIDGIKRDTDKVKKILEQTND